MCKFAEILWCQRRVNRSLSVDTMVNAKDPDIWAGKAPGGLRKDVGCRRRCGRPREIRMRPIPSLEMFGIPDSNSGGILETHSKTQKSVKITHAFRAKFYTCSENEPGNNYRLTLIAIFPGKFTTPVSYPGVVAQFMKAQFMKYARRKECQIIGAIEHRKSKALSMKELQSIPSRCGIAEMASMKRTMPSASIWRPNARTVLAALALCMTAFGNAADSSAGHSGLEISPENDMTTSQKGYGVIPTGLRPAYPAGYHCSPLTSLYASWVDVDGGLRDAIHTGVDGGRLGEWIMAPADGTIRAVWRSNWQWGWEGSLLIIHDRDDVNLDGEAQFYASEFDHLDYNDINRFKIGERVKRGQPLAKVARPGGKPKYLPETHWEVWELESDKIVWKKNKFNAPVWSSKGAELIDPLYMLGRNQDENNGHIVNIVPYEECRDYEDCRGFTYILPCVKL